MSLTPEQVTRFTEDGYLIHGDLITTNEAAAMQAAYLQCLDDLREQDELPNMRESKDPDGLVRAVYQLRCAHLMHPLFDGLIRDARLLDPVQSIIGPNIRVILIQGLYKPPRSGGVIAWHQDDYYFRVERDNAMVSCWLTFDDVTIDSGCMWVIPGGHRSMVEHRAIEGGLEISGVDESAAVPVELKAGQCMFHHGLMPHRTLENRSERHRCALAMHFMDANVRLGESRMKEPQEHMPIVRGSGIDW